MNEKKDLGDNQSNKDMDRENNNMKENENIDGQEKINDNKNNNQIEKKKLNNKKNKKVKKIRSKRRLAVVLITIIALIFGYIFARGNYLEFKEIGNNFIAVYTRNTVYTVITFIFNFLFLYFMFYFTNKKIKKGLKVFFDDEKKEMPKFPNKSISFIIALIGSIVSTKMMLNNILLCFSNSKFGISDPVFKLDIGYWIFQKPLIQFIIFYLLAVIIATIVYAVVYSLIVLNRCFDGVSRESIEKCNLIKLVGPKVKAIAILLGLVLLVTMVTNIGNEKFTNIELNDGTQYSLYGAGNSDATVKLWGYIILSILAVIFVFKTYKAVREKSMRRAIGYILIVPVYLIILALVLALYQWLFIGSNDLEKNQQYISKNIEMTKSAYGINENTNIIKYSGTITDNEINSNTNLLNNVSIATADNVLQDLKTSQTSKGYYTFRNTQIEAYNIDNKPTLVYITPREISNTNTTYSNKTYQYTHGYGSIVTLAGNTDEYGNLSNVEKDFGDLSDATISIKEPRIYYGLETNDAVVINSTKSEFDYLDSTTNLDVEYTYKGNAGLNLNFFDRLILGIKEGDLKLAFSGSITSQSKILTNRNIINRAKTIMPYLTYDENPYMVVDDSGNQYWVIDAYTTSNDYPFSQKTQLTSLKEINYIRNSVKVIINAYDGSTKFYITDRTDPIAMAYSNMYPDLFESKDSAIPTDISKHFAYPKYLYNIQAKLVEKYHNIQPEVLYRGNDIWQIAETTTSGKETEMTPYYTMVKNSSDEDILGLVIPYTIYGKQNIISYMVGTYENGKSKLNIYEFPNDSNVLGPIQLETQINQDETIASDIASLNVSGTKITKNMIAVPINNTLIYVETVYQQLINEVNQKPTLKRVVVASGNKVAIGNNMETALHNLLSKYAVDLNVSSSDNMQDLVNQIIKANKNVKDSSKNNDWKLFGEDMQKLTGLVDQLENVVKEDEANTKNEIENNSVATNNAITNTTK